MDIVNQFMNVTAPLVALLFYCLLSIPYSLLKLLCSIFHLFFSENVRGKVILITGASSGIGEEITYQYAKRGASVALVARREQRLHEVANKSRELGSPDVHVIAADVSQADECKRFVDEAVDHFGRLDHLVNNAGITCVSMFEEATDITNFESVMVDINFWGAIYPTYYALPHLKRNRGKIIVNSSAAGWLPMPRMSLYNASKAALISFYETLRTELGPEVSITIATPGWVESEMTQGKFLNKSGDLQVDQEVRDVQVGPLPVGYAEGCAKAIVNGACRKKRYVTWPFWFKVMFLYKILAPEVLEWCYRILYVKKSWSSQHPTSKVLLEASRAKNVMYPESIKSDETKTD